jgi:hypothetical protein
LGNKKTNPSLRIQRELLLSQDLAEVGNPFQRMVIELAISVLNCSMAEVMGC